MRCNLAVLLLLLVAAAPAYAQEVSAGPLRATVTASPFSVRISQARASTLTLVPAYRDGNGTHRATSAEDSEVVATEGGGPLRVRVARAGGGVLAIEIEAPAGATATLASFAGRAGDRFYGFGERSDFVERRGHEAEAYVSDGPFREEDRNFVKASTPPWAQRDRDDSTYYPVPWLLSSGGYGVLVDEDVTSRFRPSEAAFDADVDGARLRLRVFAGPTPARALARFTAATGRQAEPQAPWAFGPWFQTGQPNVVPFEEERSMVAAQREAGAPVSVAETQMHYLPCGAHEGREEAERARADAFHGEGLARLVYFNPSLCTSYREVYDRAVAAGVLQQVAGAPFSFPAFVGGSGPLGFTQEPLAQFDFTHPATEAFYAELVREAVEHGADGWMEDFGEGTPPAVTFHDGTTGDAAHNRYPTDYHCALQRISRGLGRPVVRFQRSGWTGTAACAEVVWGGDPTTVFGFDGLSSAVTQVLSAGLSGVSRWGTDIGGYNSFGGGYQDVKPGGTEDEKLTPELLGRWIELGALVPVMRTKRSGIALPSYDRPQVFDEETLPLWRRMTELHTQLNPYLRAADDAHRATGLPIVRHLVLRWPRLARAADTHDQWLLGPSLLAAPVTAAGASGRPVWLPPGRWAPFWSSTRMDDDGTVRLARADLVPGDGEVDAPAPLGSPPLFVRAGAVLPLLGGDVDTLSPYGGPGIVRAADRAGRLRILAFPRGRTRARLPDGGVARSVEARSAARTARPGTARTARRDGARHRWTLTLRSPAVRRWSLEASMLTLRRPFHPRRVRVNGKRARFAYDRGTGVLRVRARGARVRVVVR